LNTAVAVTRQSGEVFAHHQKITEILKCDVYFADPYCSWQRGLNENTYGRL
jgi:IS30 family transposase